MSNVFEFVAENRDLSGKGAARAVRRNNQVPAVIYGGDSAPQSIVLRHDDVQKHLEREAVYSHVLDLNVDGKTEKAILKAVQRHPAKAKILHLDFMRIDLTHALKVHVPLHFINGEVCPGVKEGGVATPGMIDVEVSCLPAVLPEFIEVDLSALEIGGTIHLSQLVLPEGVEIPVLAQGSDHDHTVVQVLKIRGPKEDDDIESEEEPEEES